MVGWAAATGAAKGVTAGWRGGVTSGGGAAGGEAAGGGVLPSAGAATIPAGSHSEVAGPVVLSACVSKMLLISVLVSVGEDFYGPGEGLCVVAKVIHLQVLTQDHYREGGVKIVCSFRTPCSDF